MAVSCASFTGSLALTSMVHSLSSTGQQRATPVAVHIRAVLSQETFLSGRPFLCSPGICHTRGSYKRRVIEAKSGNKLVETVIGTGKAGLDVATNLVPDAVPRPVARGGVIAVGALVGLSVVKSILSTAVSLVVVGGLAYVAFVNAKKNDTGGSSGKDSDPLDEAKRIMDKYK